MAATDRIEKKHEKNKIRNAAQKDESKVTFYLHASIFLFFLLAYTFLLFLHKNKYPLILNNEILPEVLFACFGLLIFAFSSLFLLSFWRFLARLFIAAVAGGAIAYILGLLFPFNVGNYFAHYISFLPQNILMYIAGNGNQIVAVVAGVLFFILLNMFKGGAMAFLTLPVLVATFMLLNTASKQTRPEKIQTASVSTDEKKAEKTENLIYLILADHTSYAVATENWQKLNAQNANPATLPFSPTFIPAFYKSNDFTFYPTAYLRYTDKYRNIGNVLNPSLTEIGNDLFDRKDAAYYISSEDAFVSAKRNELFKALKEKGYNINVYQSYPFDFCSNAGAKEIASCVTYPAPLGALYQTNMSTVSRLALLAGHWLYSTPFGKQVVSFIQEQVKDKVDLANIPLLGNPLSHSLPVGQPLVLSHLRQDVLKATGKNVFFSHLNLPHYPYVYDKNCQLRKDPMAWRSKEPYTQKKQSNEELRRWEDYNQQLFCSYAQINYLINDLKKANMLNKTTIVIHGDKGAGIKKGKEDENALTRVEKRIEHFKNNMTTVLGVYTPGKKAKTDTASCDIATLINRHVLGNNDSVCQPPEFTSFTKEEQDKSTAWMSVPVSDTYLKTSEFNSFYSDWLEKGGQAYMASLDERLKQAEENTPSSKISFVAPPAFMKTATQPEEKKNAKEKTTDFVPVPLEETTKTDTVPLPDTENKEEKPKEKETVPENGVIKEEPEKEMLPAVDIIADDLDDLPKPIVLPESSATDKWKTIDIKEGQKTTLELLPQIETEKELSVSPDTDIPPTPQAAPSAQVDILPLPALSESVEETSLSSLTTEETNQPQQDVSDKPSVQSPPLTQDGIIPPPPPAPTEQEAQAIAAAEAQIKQAEEIKAEAENRLKAEAEAKAKAEEEARLKAEAEAKAKAEEEARLKAEAEAKAKAEEEARLKAEAEAKAKAEEEARLKAEAEAKAKAEEEARLKAEAEAQIKAAEEAQAKARAAAKAAKEKAEEEERRKAEELEREEMRKKTPPPPPENADELDIIKETLVERVNEDGEVETFIYLERKPNPNRFKKKPSEERVLQQQDLDRSAEPALEKNAPEVAQQPSQKVPADETPALQQVPEAPTSETPSQQQKSELPASETLSQQSVQETPVTPLPAEQIQTERVLED